MFKLIINFLLLICFCECINKYFQLENIKGIERKSRDGKTYYAFTGIPYAKPPVGKLRLKNPVPIIQRWDDELDATKDSPKCFQSIMFPAGLSKVIIGQEDCLYLSVYTPNLNPSEKLAVLVHMHGGAFRAGEGGPKNNADYLMDGNVVLVNVHYRLGSLGFLSMEDNTLPGNFGLKDQSTALHWVKENIKMFGGDDEKITVFGVSAGGASTHYLMISPLSKNILKGVISQSGTINKFWSYSPPGTARPLAERLIESVGCGDKTGETLLDCLQSISCEEFLKAETEFNYWDIEPLVVFRPVQEPPGEGAFLPFDPLKQETTFPWMTGIVSSEGDMKRITLLTNGDSVTQQFIDNIDEYLMKYLSFDESCPAAQESAKIIKESYFPEPLTINSTLKGLGQLFADAFMILPMANGIANHKGPLYQYLYDFKNTVIGGKMLTLPEDLGVTHGSDLLTLFNYKDYFQNQEEKPDEEQVSRTMVRLWTNFAKFQKPTLDGDTVKWPKYNSESQYLHITNTLSVKSDLKENIIDFWLKLPIFTSEARKKIEL